MAKVKYDMMDSDLASAVLSEAKSVYGLKTYISLFSRAGEDMRDGYVPLLHRFGIKIQLFPAAVYHGQWSRQSTAGFCPESGHEPGSASSLR